MENSNQGQPKNLQIASMSPSSNVMLEGMSPFICNLEYNSQGSLSRRRGTSLFDEIEVEKAYRFISNEASATTHVIFETDTGSRYNIYIIATVYKVVDNSDVVSYRLHISSSNSKIKFTQNFDPINAKFLDEFGIQVQSDASTNKLYIYFNEQKSTVGSTFFPIYTIPFTNVTNTTATVGTLVNTGFKSSTHNIASTPKRIFTIGLNRTFISELNTLYYSAPTASPTASL
ncbi:MAG: hypothetical protein KAH32_07310, partial [Chlamydiia bacterium]|nr:hypothetical protein [Chlamydiia bacterium]